MSLRGFVPPLSIEKIDFAYFGLSERSIYSSGSNSLAQTLTFSKISSASIFETMFLLISFIFAMSNTAPLGLILLMLNGNLDKGSAGFALRQSSKFEFARVIRYSSTLSVG